MKCAMCGFKLIEKKIGLFPYSIGGLSKVYLKGVQLFKCTARECAEEEIMIPKLQELHQSLAEHVAKQNNVLLPEEIRFLRTHLGFSGADFAKVMGVSAETVSRWEKGKINMKETSERLLRVLVLSKLEPFHNYDELRDYASKISKTPQKRVFQLENLTWSEIKAS